MTNGVATGYIDHFNFNIWLILIVMFGIFEHGRPVEFKDGVVDIGDDPGLRYAADMVSAVEIVDPNCLVSMVNPCIVGMVSSSPDETISLFSGEKDPGVGSSHVWVSWLQPEKSPFSKPIFSKILPMASTPHFVMVPLLPL